MKYNHNILYLIIAKKSLVSAATMSIAIRDFFYSDFVYICNTHFGNQ